MNTRRLIPLLAAGALALSAAPASAATQIDGLVGPGFNISSGAGALPRSSRTATPTPITALITDGTIA